MVTKTSLGLIKYAEGFLPSVSKKAYNDLVAEYNDLRHQYERTVTDAQTTQTQLRKERDINNDAQIQITELKRKIKELEGRDTYEGAYKEVSEKVIATNNRLYEAGKTFANLLRMWSWRTENAKAGPTALAANKKEITDNFAILKNQLPKEVK